MDDRSPLSIVRISPSGTTQAFPLQGSASDPPAFVAAGPDGALWFTRLNGAHIGRMSTSGQYTEYALAAQSEPTGIVAGPDGALWFTERSANKVGRITTTGQIREFALPDTAEVQCGRYCPDDITVGPDGALWFVNDQLVGVPGIGRITTGGTMTFYSLPKGSVPSAITAGPDGNLWFTEYRGPGLGRVTPGGTVTEFQVPGLRQAPVAVNALAAGPDNGVWFTVGQGLGDPNPAATIRSGQLGRIAPDGTITMYTPPGEGTTGAIVLGPDGALWAFGGRTVTRVTLS